MLKIINDFIQDSDAADELKSPSLADSFVSSSFTITLTASKTFDAIGVGYTDATSITINGDVISLDTVERDRNGLYKLSIAQTTDTLIVTTNGTYIGRLAAGLCRFFGAAPSREPGFYTTEKPRTTASGQVVSGAGGFSGRTIGLDFRYKIDSDIYDDFNDAYATQISKGFPFFIYFDKEQHRMPYKRLYASTDNNLLFQSSVNKFLYSRRFQYVEKF